MSDHVNVLAASALEDLNDGLNRFAVSAGQVIESTQEAIRFIRDWLAEREAFWESEVERCEAALAYAEQMLESCQASGSYDEEGNYYPPDCRSEESAVWNARQALDGAYDALRTVRIWAAAIEEQIGRTNYELESLHSCLNTVIPSATASLSGRVSTLRALVSDRLSAQPGFVSPIRPPFHSATGSTGPSSLGGSSRLSSSGPTGSPGSMDGGRPPQTVDELNDLVTRTQAEVRTREAAEREALQQREAGRAADGAGAVERTQPPDRPDALRQPDVVKSPEIQRVPEGIEGGGANRERFN